VTPLDFKSSSISSDHAVEFGELKAEGFDLNLTGFDTREIDALTLAVNPAEDDVPPVPEAPVSRLGDLWLMGGHRLLCGDATKASDVAQLMGEQSADLVFTDPPYGVGYDGGTTVRDKLQGDENTDLYAPCCDMAALHSKAGAALYLWHAGVKGIAAAAAAAAAGYSIRCEIVWNKNLAQFGALSAQYKQKHEPCYYCFKRGHAPAWYGPKNEVTVWDCDRARVNDLHPTQKPVGIVERAIGNSSKAGDVVLDLFGGSGSTLIGCEQTGRACFILEIDPRYCDVICQRFMNFTGKQATLEGSGATFEHVKAGRRLEACDNLAEEALNASR
jgi:DNA modification methylase